MPDETRAIEPALTAEEWSERHKTIRLDSNNEFRIGLTADAHLVSREIWTGTYEQVPIDEPARFIPPHAMHATMALANAALPDDDPRKITREDVRRSQVIADGTWTQVDYDELREWGRSLAAKLAALLPPEG